MSASKCLYSMKHKTRNVMKERERGPILNTPDSNDDLFHTIKTFFLRIEFD